MDISDAFFQEFAVFYVIPPSGQYDWIFQSMQDLINVLKIHCAQSFLCSLMLKIFLGIMGVLTLTVGGIGVSNIMNVVVEERTREIGIKMALGAKGRSILAQFVMETMVLTAIGGSIGLGISWAICSAVPSFGMEEAVGNPVLSPPLALLTASILGLVGLVAGYFPARDASRLDPVVAMKL